ncbi:unnamed protein product [Amaranthus hypochondriacus]
MEQRDLSVYDFNPEDELSESCQQWSKLSNPKFDSDVSNAMTKYRFLQHDRSLHQSCHVSRDNVKSENFSLDMEIRIACPFGVSSENGHMTHISPIIPESPCSNGSVDAGASDGYDSSQEGSPPTSGFELVPMNGLAQDQSASNLNMEKMDNVIPTDYVYYGDKYYPACLIVFSDTSLKVETSTLEEESGTIGFEWNIEDIHGIESHWSSKTFMAKVKVRLLTKDAMLEENEHNPAGVEVLEFLVHDPLWPQRQDWIMSLDVRYQAVWSNGLNGNICEGGPFPLESSESSSDPYIPNFEDPFDQVIYPKGGVDSVSISKSDVDLLEPDIFVNDTIIDFYIKYLQNELPPSQRSRFHFFNTFFFCKLAEPSKNPSCVFDGKAGFRRVRKWTRKVNIFEKDYIFIPVNYNLHWSLLVICHPGEVAAFSEENVDESVKVPCILHMDSIRGSHTGLKDLVQSYLLEEWKEKQKETTEDIVSKFSNLRFLSLELPQQDNYTDCGLFLLHYVERFIAEAPENFSPFQINKFDSFLKPDWFVPREASLKRVYIQRLIYELLKGCPLENASHCNHESQSSSLLENKENDNDIATARMSRGKSWDALHSQPVPGMEMGLLDMSLCTNVSNLGMRNLLEHCQQFGEGASIGQPGCPTPPIREEGAYDHLAPSTLGQTFKSLDGVTANACHIDYTPGDLNPGFPWESELSNQEYPENNSPPSPNHSDDSEDIMIIEPEVQGPDHGQSKDPDEQKEIVDSLTESYASASSDMMETPAEDSQELAKIYGNNDKDELHTSNGKEIKDPSDPDLENENIEDDGNDDIAHTNEVVEDSSSDLDEERAPKRLRLSSPGNL